MADNSTSNLICTTSLGGLRDVHVQGRSVLSMASQIVRAVRQHLGDELAGLFARPVIAPDRSSVAWYSSRAGDPMPLAHSDDMARLRTELEQQLDQITALASRLRASGGSAARIGAMLEVVALAPDDAQVFVVDGALVIAGWGCEVDSTARQAAPMPAPRTAVAAAAVASTEVATHDPHRRSGALPWMRWVALLPLLAGFFYLLMQALEPLPVQAEVRHHPPRDLSGDLASGYGRKDELLGDLLGLHDQRQDRLDACVSERPADDAESRIATRYCPRDKVRRPRLAIAYDNSPSMEAPFNLSGERMDQISRAWRRSNERRRHGMSFADFLRRSVTAAEKARLGPIRAQLGDQLVEMLIKEAPSNADVTAVLFSGCKDITTRTVGGSSADRRRLIDEIKATPPVAGTPLARSIALAANEVDGTSPDAPAVIIMVSDGRESCKADPCQMARQIKQQKPWTTIHVVEFGPSTAARCVAEATGGKVYSPTSLDNLAQELRDATITTPFTLACER